MKVKKQPSTHWHNITAWGNIAERVEAELQKGSFISLEGKLATRNYTDKEGVKKYVTEIIAHDLVVNMKAA